MRNLLFLAVFWAWCSLVHAGVKLPDGSSVFARAQAPIELTAELNSRQQRAAAEGRLGLVAKNRGREGTIIPVQWELGTSAARGVLILPPGIRKDTRFDWHESKTPLASRMEALPEPTTLQIALCDQNRLVLRYNYETVEPGDVLGKVTEGNRIYARPRSDYIHPLLGLKGEELTRDWSLDHPHHRGIYWAWPEVDFGAERGDLHALQKVFARPTGNVRFFSGPVFAQVEAENQWLWEDREPIVRELTLIRAYTASEHGRFIDLAFRFVALKAGVTLARRGTTHYGGLNVRMATPAAQQITVHTDSSNAVPLRAWSDLSGTFSGQVTPSGLVVLQSGSNPDYPGEWIQYLELSWCQPTFPASGTRYPLPQGKPLVLRFRLWLHDGPAPDEQSLAALWDAYQATSAASPAFTME